MAFFSLIFRKLLDFLFPKTQKALELEKMPPEEIILRLPQAFIEERVGAQALFDYSHPLAKEFVWQIKYAGNRILAGKFGTILYDHITAELEEENMFAKYHTVALMPMPVSDKRRYERGFNQAELLTDAIKRCDAGQRFKYLPRQLAKVVHTQSQTKTASKKERLENLKGSMKVMNLGSVAGRCVVLIDDVVTTGATFAEAKRALKVAGARKVLCFAIAH